MGNAQAAGARCRQCDHFWKESNDALEEYLSVLAQREAGRKRQDQDLVEAFEAIENDSREKCQNAWQAIVDHEATHSYVTNLPGDRVETANASH